MKTTCLDEVTRAELYAVDDAALPHIAALEDLRAVKEIILEELPPMIERTNVDLERAEICGRAHFLAELIGGRDDR